MYGSAGWVQSRGEMRLELVSTSLAKLGIPLIAISLRI